MQPPVEIRDRAEYKCRMMVDEFKAKVPAASGLWDSALRQPPVSKTA